MPRIQGKPTKIAFSVNGTPLNMLSKRTARERAIDRRLINVNAYRMK